MPKSIGDVARRRPTNWLGELGAFADGLEHRDPRYEMLVNLKPPPIYLENPGIFTTKKRTLAIIGSNRSWKTRVGVWICTAIYTGIVPKALEGLWVWEDWLRSVAPGGELHRPRHVRITVGSFTKHWPTVIKPMLLSDPDHGGIGMLPEMWNNWNSEYHRFEGPDGSFLDIMSQDPKESSEPMDMRGAHIDCSQIDEGNRQSVYSESLARGIGAPNGPKLVMPTFCPQDGARDWTHKQLYGASYDVNTDERLPESEQNTDIYALRVSMRDNPDITEEDIRSMEGSIPPHQVAYRVHGFYSERAVNEYFSFQILDEWRKTKKWTEGVPCRLSIFEQDSDTGDFKGAIVPTDEHLIGENRRFDELEDPIWRLWGEPEEGHLYVMSVDVAGGGPRSDFQCCDIYDFTDPVKWLQVAQLHMRRIKPGEFGIQCVCMAYAWGNCLFAPEMNQEGAALRERVQHYDNWYTRVTKEKAEDAETLKLGWHTNKTTKPAMVETLDRKLREAYKAGHCPINSEDTLHELFSFEETPILDKNEDYSHTEYGAKVGEHDDCVDAMAIAVHIGETQRDRLSPCKLPQDVVNKVVDNHFLGEGDRPKQRAFAKMKKQPKLETLRKRQGSNHARRKHR
ncbi:MAG: hypothetical protein ACYTEQ_00785 [Planctomycetota bacterium]|jgi:hypothetical protein